MFLSLSTVINARSPNCTALIAACSPSRLLVESDFNDACFVAERTWDMVRTVAEVRNWRIEELWEDERTLGNEPGVVRRLEDNWRVFVKGKHKPVSRTKKYKKAKWDSWGDSDSEASN